MLQTFEHAFHQGLVKAYEDGADEQALLDSIGATIAELRSELVPSVLRTLKRDARRMLKERRAQRAGFERRTFKRWRAAFDLYEMLLIILTELGQEHDDETRPDAVKSHDFKFEALAHIFPRSLLVGEEILCLLRGGFPDAALSRWRSLFELNVTAQFIAANDQNIALRYLASFAFRAVRAAKETNAHAERANMEPFSPAEIQEMQARADVLEREVGCSLKRDYDWAHPALATDHPSLRPENVTFAHLEKAVGLDFWRPYYRWANQHVHAGHRPHEALLGVCESREPVALVGGSNSGFVDPLQFAAISLTHLAATFLLQTPNVDRLIMVDVLMAIRDEIAPVALKLERESLAAARKNRPAG